MSDGHLVFTANGANAAGQPTVYWFAINSNVGLPKRARRRTERANKTNRTKGSNSTNDYSGKSTCRANETRRT